MKGQRILISVLALGLLLALLGGLSQAQEPWPQGPLSPQEEVGAAFTYQGRLTDDGSLANGEYDFRFTLYDAASNGTQVGSMFPKENITVTDGLFTVELDFGNDIFTGDARYLEIGVRPGASGGLFTTLSPRQALTPAPYALSLRPDADVFGSVTGGSVIHVQNTATTGFSKAVQGKSDSTNGVGVYGHATASSGTTYGIYGRSQSTGGVGVYGFATANSGTTFGVTGWNYSTDGRGVYGRASASSGATYGVYGESDSPDGKGVYGLTSASSGETSGVYGESHSTPFGTGVVGRATAGSGTTFGVRGLTDSTSGTGVYGWAGANSGTNYGVVGVSNSSSGYAGYFYGRVHVTGNLSKGGGSFKIDHPLDPENKYLYHSFVESPDMMNVYNGNVLLGENGEAWVELPDWFEALNQDFRYQLTCIGGFAPVYIAQEIQDNRFQIAGGEPGMKVSWQVTGIRHDPYAEANRIPVEEKKPPEEQGTYLHPVEYGKPKTSGLEYQRNPHWFEFDAAEPGR